MIDITITIAIILISYIVGIVMGVNYKDNKHENSKIKFADKIDTTA